jgi:hypothetical protein
VGRQAAAEIGVSAVSAVFTVGYGLHDGVHTLLDHGVRDRFCARLVFFVEFHAANECSSLTAAEAMPVPPAWYTRAMHVGVPRCEAPPNLAGTWQGSGVWGWILMDIGVCRCSRAACSRGRRVLPRLTSGLVPSRRLGRRRAVPAILCSMCTVLHSTAENFCRRARVRHCPAILLPPCRFVLRRKLP